MEENVFGNDLLLKGGSGSLQCAAEGQNSQHPDGAILERTWNDRQARSWKAFGFRLVEFRRVIGEFDLPLMFYCKHLLTHSTPALSSAAAAAASSFPKGSKVSIWHQSHLTAIQFHV